MSKPAELPRQILAEQNVNLWIHSAPIRHTLLAYPSASVQINKVGSLRYFPRISRSELSDTEPTVDIARNWAIILINRELHLFAISLRLRSARFCPFPFRVIARMDFCADGLTAAVKLTNILLQSLFFTDRGLKVYPKKSNDVLGTSPFRLPSLQ